MSILILNSHIPHIFKYFIVIIGIFWFRIPHCFLEAFASTLILETTTQTNRFSDVAFCLHFFFVFHIIHPLILLIYFIKVVYGFPDIALLAICDQFFTKCSNSSPFLKTVTGRSTSRQTKIRVHRD